MDLFDLLDLPAFTPASHPLLSGCGYPLVAYADERFPNLQALAGARGGRIVICALADPQGYQESVLFIPSGQVCYWPGRLPQEGDEALEAELRTRRTQDLATYARACRTPGINGVLPPYPVHSVGIEHYGPIGPVAWWGFARANYFWLLRDAEQYPAFGFEGRPKADVLGADRVMQLKALEIALDAAIRQPEIVKVPMVMVSGTSSGLEGAAAVLGSSTLLQGLNAAGTAGPVTKPVMQPAK